MNVLKLNTEEMIPYPVGRNMKDTMPIVKNMAEKLKRLYPLREKSKLQFYVRGSSGAIIGGILIALMPEYTINLYHIKKSGESSHSGGAVSYDSNLPSIIVDDFVSSGETMRAIYNYCINNVNSQFIVDTVCVSSLLVGSSLKFKPNNVIAGNYRDN